MNYNEAAKLVVNNLLYAKGESEADGLVAAALREAAAKTYEDAARNCETRAKDAKMLKLREVVVAELRNRRDFFNAKAAALRAKEIK